MAVIEHKAILDTNVVLKMFYLEEDTDKADLLLSRFEDGALDILIPNFLPIEFVNVVWLRVRDGRSSRAECEDVLRRFLLIAERMQLIPAVSLALETLACSIELDHPAYDTAFVALADHLGIPFITADAKLYKKLSRRWRVATLLRNFEFADS